MTTKDFTGETLKMIPEPVVRLALQAALVGWSNLAPAQQQKVGEVAKTAAIYGAGFAASTAASSMTGSPAVGFHVGRAVRSALRGDQ